MLKSHFLWPLLALSVLFNSSCKGQEKGTPEIVSKSFSSTLNTLLDFSVPLIGVDTLKSNYSNYVILDAREKEEFDISHLPSARFIGYENPDYSMLDSIGLGDTILVYCSVGYRSEKIGETLLEKGYIAFNLYGSIFEWANRGYPLEDSLGQITNQVHGYNKLWSRFIQNDSIEIRY